MPIAKLGTHWRRVPDVSSTVRTGRQPLFFLTDMWNRRSQFHLDFFSWRNLYFDWLGVCCIQMCLWSPFSRITKRMYLPFLLKPTQSSPITALWISPTPETEMFTAEMFVNSWRKVLVNFLKFTRFLVSCCAPKPWFNNEPTFVPFSALNSKLLTSPFTPYKLLTHTQKISVLQLFCGKWRTTH